MCKASVGMGLFIIGLVCAVTTTASAEDGRLTGPLKFDVHQAVDGEFRFESRSGAAWITMSYGCGVRCKFVLDRLGVMDARAEDGVSRGIVIERRAPGDTLRIEAHGMSCRVENADAEVSVQLTPDRPARVRAANLAGARLTCRDATPTE